MVRETIPASKNAKASKTITQVPCIKAEFELLKEKYEALTIENDRNVEKIHFLEDKIKDLEVKKSKKNNSKTKTSQTSMSDKAMYPCKICIYTATCEEEIKLHLEEEHGYTGFYADDSIPCKHCDKLLDSEYELKTHIKKCHPGTLGTCNFYLRGNCMYDENVCWYSHTIKESDKNVRQQDFDCKFCEKVFERKSDFMRHRKIEHPEKIAICTNQRDSWCIFGSENCWYRHDNHITNEKIENIENSELIQRIFNMMEEFTERITNVENQL